MKIEMFNLKAAVDYAVIIVLTDNSAAEVFIR